MLLEYDIIVVGGGHAGCEAAVTSSKLGAKVLLITMNLHTIGQMSCNPAIGGIAKGQIIREIDALGGFSGIIADQSTIQFRMLNISKGPAMWSPRTQNDRRLFSEYWKRTLESFINLDFWQDTVISLFIKEKRICGVKTALGITINSKVVILTNGTFLNGMIHIGVKKISGGRSTEKAVTGITEQLKKLGFQIGRMKTGTSPRVDGRTLDYTKMEEQSGDVLPRCFSFLHRKTISKQKSCYITYTNSKVHNLIKDNLAYIPTYNGQIQSTGPRYCPSIEDKVYKFIDKDRHQIFVEPEGWHTIQVYINGLSTSLPEKIQFKMLRAISGFEKAKIICPGYAIEYDYFPPIQLKYTLETQLIQNLYFAGQINGTTGYEEAACQGLIAGINAYRKINEMSPFILKRSEAYIGVLIDDLVGKGTEEPYRMFTSRAEFRLLLRQDNADIRLTELGHSIGLASDERLKKVCKKKKNITSVMNFLKQWKIQPEIINSILYGKSSTGLVYESQYAYTLLKRPEINLKDIALLDKKETNTLSHYALEVLEQVEILIKYESYFLKEKEVIQKIERLEDYIIPNNFNYTVIKALSSEALEKLQKKRPSTLGQASRISGICPTDISILMVYLGR